MLSVNIVWSCFNLLGLELAQFDRSRGEEQRKKTSVPSLLLASNLGRERESGGGQAVNENETKTEKRQKK